MLFFPLNNQLKLKRKKNREHVTIFFIPHHKKSATHDIDHLDFQHTNLRKQREIRSLDVYTSQIFLPVWSSKKRTRTFTFRTWYIPVHRVILSLLCELYLVMYQVRKSLESVYLPLRRTTL